MISVLTKEIRKKIAKNGIMVENWKHFNRRYHTGWVLLWEFIKIVWDFLRGNRRRNRGDSAAQPRRKKGWGYY